VIILNEELAMKAWIGPVLAAAQAAHERREDAAHEPAALGEIAAEKTPAAPASGFSVKAGAQASGGRAFMNWWRRWRA
jgi:hypothetical protein